MALAVALPGLLPAAIELARYDFDADLAPAPGGSLAALRLENATTATYSGGFLRWTAPGSPGTGLILDAPATIADDYAILLTFSFDSVSGWRKIADFLLRGSDTGLYTFGSGFQFYGSTSSAGLIAAGQVTTILLERDGTAGTFRLWLDGIAQPVLAFLDTSGNAIARSRGGDTVEFRFFQDDAATTGEWANGTVHRLAVYDGPLTEAERALAFAGAPIPEPATLALLGLALSALALRALPRAAMRC